MHGYALPGARLSRIRNPNRIFANHRGTTPRGIFRRYIEMNLKIVEFASVLAGPAVGMFFAELGAEVIKIENKRTGGDVTRGWRLPTEDPAAPVSAYWAAVNYGKQHRMLDLSEAADLDEAKRLVADADVVISNFRPEAAQRMGLDADTLRRAYPRLIYAQLQSYPDPTDDRPAFDIVLQAETGFMSMTGEPGRPSVRMPVALIDLLAAHHLKEGILLALWEREKTGRGAIVRASLFESAIASLANQATNWLMGAHVPEPMGSMHPNIAPYGDQFRCADGQVLVLAIGTEVHFHRLCQVLGDPDLAQHADYRSNALRVRHRDTLFSRLQDLFKVKDAASWLVLFHDAGVPAAPIRDLADVFDLPEARALILESTEEGVITRRVRTKGFTLEP